jgi:uncharacterized metal-binding protein YceD (DUF177 family)
MTAHPPALPQPEFSRRIPVHHGVEPVQSFHIEANEGERAALAKRFDLIGLDAFTADGTVTTLDKGRRAVLHGRIAAKVVQRCVVTLDPVPAEVAEDFILEYANDAGMALAVKELELDPDAPDLPDPLEGEAIDVGEAAAEHLALSLDPYPRVPGAHIPGVEVEEDAESADPAAKNSPFTALARLVRKGDK